jgi:transcriptional regulator with XRE-family HTH domain
MNVSERIAVTPEVLIWARKTSGLDVETTAKRLQVRSEQVAAWEAGGTQPTINQLRRLAKLYKRPLVVLLLPQPPKDYQALQDFRRTGDGADLAWSPALHAEFKRALSQRDVILELGELSPTSLYGRNERFTLAPDLPREDAAQKLRAPARDG